MSAGDRGTFRYYTILSAVVLGSGAVAAVAVRLADAGAPRALIVALAAGWLALLLLPLHRQRGGAPWHDLIGPPLGLAAALALAADGALAMLTFVAVAALGAALGAALAHNGRARTARRPLPVEPLDAFASARLGAALVACGAAARFGWWPEALVLLGLGGLLVRRLPASLGRVAATAAELLPTTAARRTQRLLRAAAGWPAAPGVRVPGLPVAVSPRRAAAAMQVRAALAAVRLDEAAELASERSEAGYQRVAGLLDRAAGSRELLLELHGELAELAFRTGRYAEVSRHLSALRAALPPCPGAATARLVTHTRYLAALAAARLGQTLPAEAELVRLADERDEVDARNLRVFVRAAIRLARGEPFDVATYLRQRLDWGEKRFDPAALWWRAYARVLVAEAALNAGDRRAAGVPAGSPRELPTLPELELLRARALLQRGDRVAAGEALDWVFHLAGDGPFGRQARELLGGEASVR